MPWVLLQNDLQKLCKIKVGSIILDQFSCIWGVIMQWIPPYHIIEVIIRICILYGVLKSPDDLTDIPHWSNVLVLVCYPVCLFSGLSRHFQTATFFPFSFWREVCNWVVSLSVHHSTHCIPQQHSLNTHTTSHRQVYTNSGKRKHHQFHVMQLDF
jgi:hypothetical protein